MAIVYKWIFLCILSGADKQWTRTWIWIKKKHADVNHLDFLPLIKVRIIMHEKYYAGFCCSVYMWAEEEEQPNAYATLLQVKHLTWIQTNNKEAWRTA